MKIGVLTFHNTLNYGAVLQSYALQKKLKELGNQCEIINYECKAVEERERVKTIKDVKNIRQLIKYILVHPKQNKKRKKFDKFINQYIAISKEKYNKDNIKKCLDNYNAIIVGSDQIWNYNLTDNDTTYLLDFADEKTIKASYAASFGLPEIEKKHLETYKYCLNSFNYLSVREKLGQDIIKKAINKDVQLVVDPTFLLTKQEWIDNFSIGDDKSKDYIVYYQMQQQNELYNYAKKIAEKEKCKLINLNPMIQDIMKSGNNFTAAPSEWLKLIYNAKYVVTNSFHGLAFSIIFNKDFFIEIPRNKNNTSSRLESLLDIVELTDRNINTISIENYKQTTIQWEKVNHILNQYRKKSIEYICEIMGGK